MSKYKKESVIMNKKIIVLEFFSPFLLGVCLIIVGAIYEEVVGITIQDAFTKGAAQTRLAFIFLCVVLLLIGILFWHLKWKIFNRLYPLFSETVNSLHRAFIDISLVIISSISCWYSMIDSNFEKIPELLFVFIVPIAVAIVVIDFYKTFQSYQKDVRKEREG